MGNSYALASKFMKTMSNATPVRSPIRKTNVILKEQNFVKALALWEFLEKYQIEKPVKIENTETDIKYKNLNKNLGLTYYINYNLIQFDKILQTDENQNVKIFHHFHL